jgi:HAD superfamily hydrolase (TIGR01484 family)
MYFPALACDYDGTLAHDGLVDPSTLAALKRVRASGRKLLLVTGRERKDLQSVFPAVDLFDRVVAENGGSLYDPASHEEILLGDPPPASFALALHRRGVEPVAAGRVIVATRRAHEQAVQQTIDDLGLALQVILNKGSVMVLPSGIDKATGLKAALEALALSPRQVVAVGDAENDQSFLGLCGCGVAVANALPMLKAEADFVTESEDGAGVAEVIDLLLQDKLHVNRRP